MNDGCRENHKERLKISWTGDGTVFNQIRLTQRRPFWLNFSKHRGWCVQECKPAWNFHILFRVQSFHVESGRARRQPADGLNNSPKGKRGGRNEKKKKKERDVGGKEGKDTGNPASRLLRDTSRYRRVVVDRSFDDSGRRERFNPRALDDYVRDRLPRGLDVYTPPLSMYFQYRDKAI